MSYFITHLDILLAIFSLVLIIVSPEKQKKTVIIFVLIAGLIYVAGFFYRDPQNANLADEGSTICEDVFITDETFEDNTRGTASLYSDTSNIMPIWFEDDLVKVYFSFLIDNIGRSYAYIKNATLVIDNYEPVSMDDILLYREEGLAGAIPELKADIDFIDISEGKSEYDVNFYVYNDVDEEKVIEFREGQRFNIEQASQVYFSLYPSFNKSGIYTYHLKVNFEYYKKEYSMETAPVSFIYMEGDSSDYHYDDNRLASLNLERRYYSEESNNEMYYTIEGRTLKIHDTSKVFWDNDFGNYFSLIDTIIVGEGTKEIEALAFNDEASLRNVTKVYLPKSLECIDLDCFCYDSLESIYYGGTEEQWASLISNAEDDDLKKIEDVEIVYDYAF